jgi:pimeloyl-ACP methyl ester carboxylesterase
VDGIGAEVVLVAHSGGGMVLTEFADHPSVQHSVYLAALWPQKGQSATDLLGGQLPGWVAARDDGTIAVSSDLEVVQQTLCADIDAERFAKQVYPRYELMSLSSLASPSTAPVPQHPTTYIICEQDQVIPPQAPGSDGRRRRPRHPAAVLTLALPVHAQAAGNNPRRRPLSDVCALFPR